MYFCPAYLTVNMCDKANSYITYKVYAKRE